MSFAARSRRIGAVAQSVAEEGRTVLASAERLSQSDARVIPFGRSSQPLERPL